MREAKELNSGLFRVNVCVFPVFCLNDVFECYFEIAFAFFDFLKCILIKKYFSFLKNGFFFLFLKAHLKLIKRSNFYFKALI